jgi:hypothetical protein
VIPLRPADVVEDAGELGQEDQPTDAGIGCGAPLLLDEDQGAAVDGDLFDVSGSMAEACTLLGDEPETRHDHRLAGEERPGECYFTGLLEIETGRSDLGGDSSGKIDGYLVLLIR